MEILNEKELDAWLFEHANTQGHVCEGIKGVVNGGIVNVAYLDRTTNERFDIKYSVSTNEL